MTRDFELERDLDRLFTEGPTRAPDDVFTRFATRIEHVPQRRLARLRAGVPKTDFTFKAAAAIVIVVLGAGFGATIFRAPAAGVGSLPTSSPSSAPSETPHVAAALSEVPGWWVPTGSSTVQTTLGASSITITLAQVRMHVASQYIDSSSHFVEPNRLELTLQADSELLGCRAGDEGSYTFSVSSDGLLTLSPVTEACAARAEILAPHWTLFARSSISRGPFVAAPFRPFGRASESKFSYVVPDGWGDQDETADAFIQEGPDYDGRIELLSDAAAFGPASGTCVETRLFLKTTPTAIANWLASRPGVMVTLHVPATVGGLSGVMLDISVSPERPGSCPQNEMIASADGPQLIQIVLSGHARYILLDREDGHTLMVAFEAQDRARWDALLPDAMSMIDSFQFSRKGP